MMKRIRVVALAVALCTALLSLQAGLADSTAAIDGIWEGPWYRGMSSGKAKFEIGNGTGTVQLTNAESFGDEVRPLTRLAFDGQSMRFEAQGGGGPMTATLKLNDRGDQMKGMGKYEGFGLRFELRRRTAATDSE